LVPWRYNCLETAVTQSKHEALWGNLPFFMWHEPQVMRLSYYILCWGHFNTVVAATLHLPIHVTPAWNLLCTAYGKLRKLFLDSLFNIPLHLIIKHGHMLKISVINFR
jgi:hypothetical protein